MIKSIFEKNKNTVSDINEHLDTLVKYTSLCASVCEMCVRGAVSTSAFLYALSLNPKDRFLLSIDLQSCPEINKFIPLAHAASIKFDFIQSDSVKLDIPDVDLLFIDTWHCYGHLKRELGKHQSKVKKYIILHDTEIDRLTGENVRKKQDILKISQETGYSEADIKKGLWFAIDEFLDVHKEWYIEKMYVNNNGLTVLKRFG